MSGLTNNIVNIFQIWQITESPGQGKFEGPRLLPQDLNDLNLDVNVLNKLSSNLNVLNEFEGPPLLWCRHKIERKSFKQEDSLQSRQPAFLSWRNIILTLKKYNVDY